MPDRVSEIQHSLLQKQLVHHLEPLPADHLSLCTVESSPKGMVMTLCGWNNFCSQWNGDHQASEGLKFPVWKVLEGKYPFSSTKTSVTTAFSYTKENGLRRILLQFVMYLFIFAENNLFLIFLYSRICRSEIQEGLGEMLCLCSIWEHPNGWNLLESSSFTIWHLGWGDSKSWAVILDEKNLIVLYKMSHFIIHIKNCFY